MGNEVAVEAPATQQKRGGPGMMMLILAMAAALLLVVGIAGGVVFYLAKTGKLTLPGAPRRLRLLPRWSSPRL